MSAQTFNGVRVGGTADQPKIINQSDKPVIGYAVQRIADAEVKPISDVVARGATVAFAKPGRGSWPYQAKNSSKPRL